MTAELAFAARSSFLATVRNYVVLTKPRVITLLLVTTVPAMVVAEGGWPGTWLVLATLIGGAASAAGANVINCWYDRDIDAMMRRTAVRPTVTGEVPAGHALTFGIVLGAGAFLFLWVATTLAAAVLALTALLFYVLVYTMWLKRRTPQNIVIGGAAGAFPPVVGWAAVTGDAPLAAWVMFAIVFFWTPPHFWALSLRLEGDYARAGIPMLPVTSGAAYTRAQILRYTLMLIPVTLLLGPAAGLGGLYASAAAVLGGAFAWIAWRLWRSPEAVPPLRVYKFSLLYLGLLFVAMGLEAAL